ncbi:hypothetical protein AB0M48_44795 [Lentzea sp. NPDC051208]|uniref:hypothetical protein n=1 Tax=Lentzea sp. NPDC051208 TaxID=3154642 RepID=UPI0034441181
MKRTFTALAVLASTMGLVLVGGQASAAPESQVRFELGIQSADAGINIYAGSALAGYGDFNADPDGSVPGDAIRACDTLADGWGIETQLDINPGATWDTDRVVNTRGHASPYCSGWASGNIGENTPVAIRVCLVKSGETPICSGRAFGES